VSPLNFAGKFDFSQFDVGGLSGPSADVLANSGGLDGAQPSIVVPDAHLLFAGDYKRAGLDLVLSKDGHDHVVNDYFKGHVRAALSSPDGARLSGALVESLTGEVQVAQLSGTTAAATVIGRVTKLSGSATAIRNGVSIQLNMGDNVNKGDVVQAGSDSSLGLTFIDGTVFGLSSNARMVLNEMVYDPNGSSNSSLLSLVQGTITFVAGETAKHGDMRVDTPVATMGIRGTAVLVEIDFTVPGTGGAPPVKFQVLVEPGGHTGSYVLYSKSDPTQVIGTVNQAGQVTSVTGDGTPSTAPAPLSPEALAIIPVHLPGDMPGTPPINVIVTRFNTAPTIVVAPLAISLTEDRTGFKLADQVKIVDPDIGDGVFNDIAVPYVAGTGKVVSAVGPANVPPGLDLAKLVTIDPQTGAVSYDPAAFRFLGEGQKAVFTISFESRSGPDTVHETLTFTIDGVNDAPVITAASISVSNGGTVVVQLSDIGIFDPDSSSFTFYATATHGSFEILVGSNWVTLASGQPVTSADIAAGHIRFHHDGSGYAPDISVVVSDGSAVSTPFSAHVDFTPDQPDTVYHLTSTAGTSIDVSGHGATNGFVLPGAGNVTTPGTPEDRIVLGYHIGANQNPVVVNGSPLIHDNGFTPVSHSEVHNTDGSNSVVTSLDAGHGVTLTQTIALGADANFFTTTIDVFNGGATDLTGVRFMRSFDPDQDQNPQGTGTYNTLNDVIHNPTNADDVAIVSAKGPSSGAEVALIGLNGAWRASSYGFTNTDPYAAQAYASPVDPNGAQDDRAISLTYDFGTIAAGTHATVTYITTNNVATNGSNALYGTEGADIINGLGGDDLLIGLGGADTFVFAANSGHDTIYDFQTNLDHIDLSALASTVTQSSLCNWMTDHVLANPLNSADTLITLDAGNTILLHNVAYTSLHASDFIVHT
jgi:Ca2+-binding RTX toxin-like protein